MIEIKCTQEEKENFIDALSDFEVDCVFVRKKCQRYDGCRDCLDERIKWTIRGNEDAE